MKSKSVFSFVVSTVVALAIVPAHGQLQTLASLRPAGAVYTLNNETSENRVVVFDRAPDGSLYPTARAYATGGTGTGLGLASQGALAIDAANRFLFAVNAGSDNISVLRIEENKLVPVDLAPSGGRQPISLTVSHNILYVLNNGAAVGQSDTVAGFTVAPNGHLKQIINNLPLSAPSVGPAEISFNDDGDVLLVAEKATNKIDLFTVNNHGVASGPAVFNSAGQTPYGFAFGNRNQVFFSEAFGGAPGAGALSSYRVTRNGMLHSISPSAPDQQSAPCWVALTSDGRFVYTTNTGSGSVSGYQVGFGGVLGLLDANGVTASTGSGSAPIDAAVSNDSRYLYVLTPGTQNIQGFAIDLKGALTPINQGIGIPASSSGLIAR